MHSLLIDIDHVLQELRGAFPAQAPVNESAVDFRRRQAALRAIRVLAEADREIRGEPTDEQATTQAYFAFACGG